MLAHITKSNAVKQSVTYLMKGDTRLDIKRCLKLMLVTSLLSSCALNQNECNENSDCRINDKDEKFYTYDKGSRAIDMEEVLSNESSVSDTASPVIFEGDDSAE